MKCLLHLFSDCGKMGKKTIYKTGFPVYLKWYGLFLLINITTHSYSIFIKKLKSLFTCFNSIIQACIIKMYNNVFQSKTQLLSLIYRIKSSNKTR